MLLSRAVWTSNPRCLRGSQASIRQRGNVDLRSVREAIRRLFSLLENAEDAREGFLERIAEEVIAPVRDDAFRQIRQRDNASQYWDELGGVEGAARVETEVIVQRFLRWLDDRLE